MHHFFFLIITIRLRLSSSLSLSQAFSSSLSGTLATQASLKGVGVGNQEATVAAATITWLLRGDALKYAIHLHDFCMVGATCKLVFFPVDGTGMMGRILFAWRKGWAPVYVTHSMLTFICAPPSSWLLLFLCSPSRSKLDSEAKKWRYTWCTSSTFFF